MKVLVARTDRLGDVVLSLPVFEFIKRARPDWQVHALVASGAMPLVENDPHVDAIWSSDGLPDDRLAAGLAAERFDAVLLLLYRRELAALMRRIGIRRRIGPLSKWSSWLLLNRGVWQGRSRVKLHEWEYNLRLAEKLIGRGTPYPEPRIHLAEIQREIGREFRRQEAPDAGTVVFVHPGSGGSALDWEPIRFAAVANALVADPGVRVFVTGSHQDRLLIDLVAPELLPEVTVIAERYQLREFLGVLTAGDLLIGPSTGPLHMAAALGSATVGLFPPVATMSSQRWGSRGSYSRSLEPDVSCPARRYCTEERCLLFNCMQGIYVSDVVAAARQVIRQRAAAATAGTDTTGPDAAHRACVGRPENLQPNRHLEAPHGTRAQDCG